MAKASKSKSPQRRRRKIEWLNLLDRKGPFLTPDIIGQHFPDLHQLESEARVALLKKHADWQNEASITTTKDWVEYMLGTFLQYNAGGTFHAGAEVPASCIGKQPGGRALKPDYALLSPKDKKPVILVATYLDEVWRDGKRVAKQALDKPVGRRHSASPKTRMQELLQSTYNKDADCPRLGLVTNGEEWCLVHSKPEMVSSFITWRGDRFFEFDSQRLHLRSFHDLLTLSSVTGKKDHLAKLIEESASDHQSLTDRLGIQARRAVEILVSALDSAEGRAKRSFLPSDDGQNGAALVYEASVTVLMRLIFLLYAEENQMIGSAASVEERESDLYYNNYALSPLFELLQGVADSQGEAFLDQAFDAWGRINALFRVIFSGVNILDGMQIPAYGGDLFDPERFAFLEGRTSEEALTDAQPLLISNLSVFHILRELKTLDLGGERVGQSYTALDVEQIGYIYEGLLDHTAKRSTGWVLGLKGSKEGAEPEIPLEELIAWEAKGELAKQLKGPTGKDAKAIKKWREADLAKHERDRIRDRLYAKIDGELDDARDLAEPFYGLIRKDALGRPTVIQPNRLYVTDGDDRRQTGTHYTPPTLTQPVVRYALEPLVYDGPREGKPEEEWKLKGPGEILGLKICDMACGSGAFLVQACRYLADRLMEAWEEREKKHPADIQIAPNGTPSNGQAKDQLVPRGDKHREERRIFALRHVAERCIYGVDINPLAVEMCKLSLWLTTMDRAKPFTFLNHAIRCGDSLFGLIEERQLRQFRLEPGQFTQVLWSGLLTQRLQELQRLRARLTTLPSTTIEQINDKRAIQEEVARLSMGLNQAADICMQLHIRWPKAKDFEKRLPIELMNANKRVEEDRQVIGSDRDHLVGLTHKGKWRRPFHWFLEFPEVFPPVEETVDPADAERARSAWGFDAFIGNPPFVGGKKITGAMGTDYRDYLVRHLAKEVRGHADYVVYFHLRSFDLLSEGGTSGLVSTNTVAQGDSREVGLDQLQAKGSVLYRGETSHRWPGVAALEIVETWQSRGAWHGKAILDGKAVEGITPMLTTPGAVSGNPYRLLVNSGLSFQGSIVLGKGWVLKEEAAKDIIASDSRNEAVLFPYLRGADFLNVPRQVPPVWVINFFDWPLDREGEGVWQDATVKERNEMIKDGHAPADYPENVAADYPTCLEIIERLVKPERRRPKKDRNGKVMLDASGSPDYALRYPLPQKWWIYCDKRPALYAAISALNRVLFHGFTCKYLSFGFTSAEYVYAGPHNVFALQSSSSFACLMSAFHETWIRDPLNNSSLETRLRYTTDRYFETFPFPASWDSLEDIGDRYHEYRRQLMLDTNKGLTDTYNHFHKKPDGEPDPAIQKLRDLHVEMDEAVKLAYGWDDLQLDHGFHETKQGLRFTISESARREVLDRLLALNHERHDAEVAAGYVDEKGKPTKKGKEWLAKRKPGEIISITGEDVGQGAKVKNELFAAKEHRGMFKED